MIFPGATGIVGREAVRLLVEGGAKVAAVTRSPHADFPEGAQLVHPAEVATLNGVEAILLSPCAVGAAAADLLARACETGTRKVVVLSAVTVQMYVYYM